MSAKDFYEFSPEDSTTVPVLSVEGDTTGYKKLPGVWTVTDSLPGEEPIWGMVGFTINGVGYIGAGQTKNQGYANTYYSYNPNAAKGKKWQIVEHINPAKRCYGSVFVIDDRAYIVGGISNGKYVYDLERFDPSIDEGEFRWQKITQNFVEDYRSSRFVKVYRQQAAAFSINGRGYLCCGSVGSSKSDVWEYTMLSGSIGPLGGIDFTGQGEGTLNNIVANGCLNTGIGNLNVSVEIDRESADAFNVSGHIASTPVALNSYIGKRASLRTDLTVNGVVGTAANTNINVNGMVNSIRYANVSIDSVAINGRFAPYQRSERPESRPDRFSHCCR